MRLELTESEVALLRELVESAIAQAREETYKTEASEWKHALKDRQQLMAGLMGKLRAGS